MSVVQAIWDTGKAQTVHTHLRLKLKEDLWETQRAAADETCIQNDTRALGIVCCPCDVLEGDESAHVPHPYIHFFSAASASSSGAATRSATRLA